MLRSAIANQKATFEVEQCPNNSELPVLWAAPCRRVAAFGYLGICFLGLTSQAFSFRRFRG